MRILFTFALLITLLPLVTPTATISAFELLKTSKIISQLSKILLVNNHEESAKEKAIFSRLENISVQLGNDVNVILRILNDIPGKIRYELRMNEIRSSQYFLETYYADFEKLIRDMDLYENSTQIEFANGIVSPNPNSVISLMKVLYRQVTSSEFLDLIYEHFAAKETSYFCTVQQSLPETFHNILKGMFMLNLKSLVMIHSAYKIKKKYGQGTFKRNINEATEVFQTRINGLIAAVSPYMAKSSSEMWRCDPKKHIEGETFLQITNFLHGYISNKVNRDATVDSLLSNHLIEEERAFALLNLNERCEKIYNVHIDSKNVHPSCSKPINCQNIDTSVGACMTHMHTNNRRYEYIEFGNGRIFGKKRNCHEQNRTYHSLDTFCTYSFCLCDEGPKFFSDRYINLRRVTANLTDNRIVTGVRFIKNNQIIHLQIQEGKLLSYGQIDIDSLRWVPPDNYTPINDAVFEEIDFHTLTWKERGIDLVDIKVREGSVVTGVRFRKVGTRLHLEVQSTPFNFSTGQLEPRRTVFEKDPHLRFKHKFRRQLKVAGTDVPTRARSPSTEFTTNKFVEFINSDFVKDAGQTTVPFFDAQPATSKKPVPLAGIGIFHKGRPGYGGFIIPRIFTHSFVKHLKEGFPRD